MSDLTDWFPVDVKPVRKGVYMASICKQRFYRYWNGCWWSHGVYELGQENCKSLFSIKYGNYTNQAEIEWRGLASDPSKVRKQPVSK